MVNVHVLKNKEYFNDKLEELKKKLTQAQIDNLDSQLNIIYVFNKPPEECSSVDSIILDSNDAIDFFFERISLSE